MWGPTRRSSGTQPPRGEAMRHPWRAVSVVATKGGCESVRALSGKRFLCAQAPRLPLPDCPYAHRCACIYRKHEDRRAGPRRETDELPWKSWAPVAHDRRIQRDRRKTHDH